MIESDTVNTLKNRLIKGLASNPWLTLSVSIVKKAYIHFSLVIYSLFYSLHTNLCVSDLISQHQKYPIVCCCLYSYISLSTLWFHCLTDLYCTCIEMEFYFYICACLYKPQYYCKSQNKVHRKSDVHIFSAFFRNNSNSLFLMYLFFYFTKNHKYATKPIDIQYIPSRILFSFLVRHNM